MARKKKTRTAKKQKIKTDGLGPEEKRKIRNAIRQIWQRSHARKLAAARCVGADGFARCENPKCRKKGKAVPKVTIDHTTPVGELGPGFIERMFVPSSKLKGLCKECHKVKTNEENKRRRAAAKRLKDEQYFT